MLCLRCENPSTFRDIPVDVKDNSNFIDDGKNMSPISLDPSSEFNNEEVDSINTSINNEFNEEPNNNLMDDNTQKANNDLITQHIASDTSSEFNNEEVDSINTSINNEFNEEPNNNLMDDNTKKANNDLTNDNSEDENKNSVIHYNKEDIHKMFTKHTEELKPLTDVAAILEYILAKQKKLKVPQTKISKTPFKSFKELMDNI